MGEKGRREKGKGRKEEKDEQREIKKEGRKGRENNEKIHSQGKHKVASQSGDYRI